MKKITLALLVLMAGSMILTGCQTTGVKTDSPKNTVRLEKYGIELTLPDRWKITIKKRGEWWILVKAPDKYDEANIHFYARSAKEQSIDEWMDGRILKRLDGYSEGYGYSGGNNPKHKKIDVKGLYVTVDVKYYSLNINGNNRRTAFIYFPYKGKYFYFFVHNTGAWAPLEKIVEKIIIPGIRFL